MQKKISNREKRIETKSKRRTSRLGKIISFSALFIPLGSALLNKVNANNFTMPFSQGATSPNWWFILGILFCFSPILVLIYWRFLGDRDQRTGKVAWELISSESTEDITQDITSDSEQTSLEFEEYFRAIATRILDKKIADRIIIVIDNLDRIEPNQAKNIWSTLQTFFQSRASQGRDWTDKVWFIIPFDRDGFIKIWESRNESAESSELANSFLNKCFQLIAEVPEPVISSWPDYAEKRIEQALLGWPV